MKTLDVEQRSQAWFEARRGMPTASRFDMILTPAKGEPSKSQDTLINQLISESILPPQEGELKYTSEEMIEGMRLEAEARCKYMLDYAKGDVKEVGFIIHESGLFGASPDGLTGEDGGLELKCPAGPTIVSYIRAGVLPPEYRCQVHGSMVVTGRKYWDFMAYHRSFPEFFLRVERDEFTDKLEAELFSFAKKYNEVRVKFGLPPLSKS